MIAAVFGDLHGHLRLMWKLVSYWQRENSARVDAILQCGDIGYFPDPNRVDRATRRYLKIDPEELGLARYFVPESPWFIEDPRVAEIITGDSDDLKTVSAPVYACSGNHEDFEALEARSAGRAVFCIDQYRRFHVVRSGTSLPLDGVTVGFVGGGPEHQGPEQASAWNAWMARPVRRWCGSLQTCWFLMRDHEKPRVHLRRGRTGSVGW